MAPARRDPDRPADGVPGVRADMRRSIDREYSPDQEGSAPPASVTQEEERNVWPAIWAAVTILMILIALYLIFG